MGNQDSKPQKPGAPPKDLKDYQGISEQFRNRAGIAVVNTGPAEQQNLTASQIIAVTTMEKNEQKDPALEELDRLPVFLPLIKQSFKGWDKIPGAQSFTLEPMNSKTLLDLATKYQRYLRKSIIESAQEQRRIVSNLKKLETITNRALASLSIKASAVRQLEHRFRDVDDIANHIATVQTQVDRVMNSLERLNQLLPSHARLKSFQPATIPKTLRDHLFVRSDKTIQASTADESTRFEHVAECAAASDQNVYPLAGIASQQGSRPTMEDTHVLFNCLHSVYPHLRETLPTHISFYGVYDGHGGVEAANIAKTHVHTNFLNSVQFLEQDYREAFHVAYEQTDKVILEQAAAKRWRSGSTAVNVCIIGNQLYVANAGDSEAVIGRRNVNDPKPAYAPILLTRKHAPTEPSERARIEKAGGVVYYGRVCGSLAVSRAFGDIDLKPQPSPYVVATPFVDQMELTAGDEFLIVACDGLWDVFSYNSAVKFVATKRKKQNLTAQQVAAELCYEAIVNRRSTDNVTVIVVYLTPFMQGK